MLTFPVLYRRLIQGRLLKAKAFIIMVIKSIIQVKIGLNHNYRAL
jgi:hypothetical protein